MKISDRLFMFVFVALVCAFTQNEWFDPPASWPEPVYNFTKNPLTEEKIELGRALFYDPGLSRDSSISCASCHSSYTAFTHIDHKRSHGIHDSIGLRNSPALMNLAWQTSFMWDGAINHLDMQALAPITHPAEMGSELKDVVTKLQRAPFYEALFQRAFGSPKVTGERVLKALSQFMLTLVSAHSKYDRVKNGEAQFTPQEQHGYALFQQKCAVCHQEPLFTTNGFANNGMPVDTALNDFGKMRITSAKKDSLLFKIPTLRNIEYTFPYMHDGRFSKLSEVLNHYQKGIQPSATLAKELQKQMQLSAEDKVDIIAFLLTLSDKEFVLNRQFAFPRELFLKRAKDASQ